MLGALSLNLCKSVDQFNSFEMQTQPERTIIVSRLVGGLYGTCMVDVIDGSQMKTPQIVAQVTLNGMAHCIDIKEGMSKSPEFMAVFNQDVNNSTLTKITEDRLFNFTNPPYLYAEAVSRQLVHPGLLDVEFEQDFSHVVALVRERMSSLGIVLQPPASITGAGDMTAEAPTTAPGHKSRNVF
jgi:hypothetical protein